MAEHNSNGISKVLMTADTLGGVWTYAMVLGQELGHRGIEVHLATMGRRLSDGQRDTASKIPNLHIYESDYKLEWMQDPWRDVKDANRWLQELEREIQPDIVHLNGYAHGKVDWDAPALVVAHSDVYSWHYHVKGTEPVGEWETYRREVEEGLERADLIVAVTEAVKQDLLKHFSFSTDVSVRYNGLPENDFHLSDKHELVLGLGRIWDEAKNFHMLNEVAAEMDIQVAIAGENEHPESGRATDMGHVWLTGSLERKEVKRLLAQSAVYCLPAKYEPFGYTPLEAAFSGCALLLSDIASLREVWQDAALYFDPEDARDLKEKIKELFADERRQKELAEKAQERAKKFTAKNMVLSYVELYRNMLKQKPLAVYEN